MVSKNLLLAMNAGLGRGETAIFPILIFKVKEGVNYNPEDPNYDLFKLAIKVSAKRLFPNFSFLDAPFNLQYYKEGDYHTEAAYMGCVDGIEIITYKIKENLYVESFERAWNRLSALNKIKTYGVSKYMNLTDVTIYDSNKGDFVVCEKIIKNPDRKDWYRIKFDNGRTLLATSDHPLPVDGKGRTFVKDMKTGDLVPLADNVALFPKSNLLEVTSIEFLGFRDKESYDVTTESDMFDVSGIQSHNCRTRVMSNINGPEIATGRGNLSFTSINLPRLGIKYGLNKETPDMIGFYKELDKILELVKNQLLERYKAQIAKKVKNFPFMAGQGVWLDSEKLGREDTLEETLKHGTLSVGFIGLAETLKALTGKHHGESEEAQNLGLEIIGHMRKRLDEYTEEYKLNFSLIATPAEGLSGRFIQIDKELFGEIEGITDREYYTNSFHIPVYHKINAFNKIKLEAPYHALTNAGHISYVELDGSPLDNLEAFEKIVRLMKKSGIGYGSINHPVDRDPVCGYTGIIKDTCPQCGRAESSHRFERIRRITGYLAGTLDRFNDAKKAEERDRVKHM